MAVNFLIAGLETGGTERGCLTLCNQMVESGIPVRLVLLRETGAFRALVSPSAEVHCFQTGRIRKSFGQIRSFFNSTDRPTLVFGVDLAVALALACLSRRSSSPRLVYREGTFPLQYGWKAGLIYRCVGRRFDAVIAQTRTAAAQMEQLGVPARKIFQIPNPLSPAARELSARRRAKVDPSQAHLVAVGRLESVKNFDLLLKSFAEFHRKYPGSKLTIFGEGSERPRLESLIGELGISDCAKLAGENRDLKEIFATADIYLACSKFEGMSNALIEAILSGCRVFVGAGGGGTQEFLENTGLGHRTVPLRDFKNSFIANVARILGEDSEDEMAAAALIRGRQDPAAVAQAIARTMLRP
jgi:glycosyltransferase involved in cell wall biosynthesis